MRPFGLTVFVSRSRVDETTFAPPMQTQEDFFLVSIGIGQV